MKRTNLSAEVIYLTPKIAKDLLESNKGNRNVKKTTFRRYVNDMIAGYWKENGEPIIIDKNGIVKDGQHRLLACIEANFSFWIPLIKGVDPDVMDTIDTGINRSLSDVLKFNGYKNSTNAAALVKSLVNYQNKRKALSKKGDAHRNSLTNARGLSFMDENHQMVSELVNFSVRNWTKQVIKTFGTTQIGFYTYVLTKGDFSNPYIEEFIKELCGITKQEGNAVAYVRKTATKAKQNKIGLDSEYLLALVIKAWNSYVSGDPEITYIRHNIKHGLPKVVEV